jgi:hypothetical protein
VTNWSDGLLEAPKAARVAEWLGEPRLVEDLSWGLVDTVVLRVRCAAGDVVVKTAGSANHHIGREIAAHREATATLVAAGRTAPMLGADPALNLLALEYQAGYLAQGSGNELSYDVHRQAGEILRLFHSSSPSRIDENYVSALIARASRWLKADHRIEPGSAGRAADILESTGPRPVRLVPTHGDWHSRNWLIDDGFVKAIDFGRFAWRSASSDLCRLAVKEWRRDPSLETAFLRGYGDDPRRDAELWRLELLCEAIGTAAWAFQVHDDEFEAQGHRQLTEALTAF